MTEWFFKVTIGSHHYADFKVFHGSLKCNQNTSWLGRPFPIRHLSTFFFFFFWSYSLAGAYKPFSFKFHGTTGSFLNLYSHPFFPSKLLPFKIQSRHFFLQEASLDLPLHPSIFGMYLILGCSSVSTWPSSPVNSEVLQMRGSVSFILYHET